MRIILIVLPLLIWLSPNLNLLEVLEEANRQPGRDLNKEQSKPGMSRTRYGKRKTVNRRQPLSVQDQGFQATYEMPVQKSGLGYRIALVVAKHFYWPYIDRKQHGNTKNLTRLPT